MKIVAELKVELKVFSFSQTKIEPCLSSEESERAAQIPDKNRRCKYIFARSLVRRSLSRRLGLEPHEIIIETSATGKPWLPRHPDFGFSLSHSGDWLVLATANGAVGIDIETQLPRTNPERLAERFFSRPDFLRLSAFAKSKQNEMFRRQWVAKEAAIKAEGTGLANLLHRAVCEYDGETIRAVGWDDRRFPIRHFQIDDGPPGAVAASGFDRMDILPNNSPGLEIS